MSGHYFVGVDAGTSVTKVALVDSRGAIRRVLGDSGVAPREVAGVGVTAAMVGAYVLDASGAPVRPGILWSDGRTGKMLERMARDGVLSRIFRTSGCVMQTGCTLPLLRWLLDHEPDAMTRARTVFGAKDWLGFKLTGVRATDASEAAVAPGDARTQNRSAPMIELFGLGGHAHLLPPVLPSGSLLGEVTAEAAAQTGLRSGTPVAAAAGGRSRFWAQVISDVTGLAVSVPAAEEPGALGAAVLASRAIGTQLEPSSDRTRWSLAPDLVKRSAYDAAFRRFVEFRKADALP